MDNASGLVSSKSHGSIVVATVTTATVDIRNAKQFQKDFFEQVGESKQVVLDMSGIEFIDSAGLGSLISSLRQILAKSGDLKLASPTTRVQVLLEVTRLDRVFQIFQNLEEAVAAFGS